MASDAELIAACRGDDEAAWAEVYDRYHRLIRSIALSYGLEPHDADEIVQVVLSILHGSIHKLRPDSKLSAWLSTVTRRHTWRRLEVRRRESPAVLADTSLVHDDVRQQADRDAEEAALRDALRELPSKCRALIEALYLRGDEPSYAQIADEFSMPIGSIGPTRARCLDRLRTILEAASVERVEVVAARGTGQEGRQA